MIDQGQLLTVYEIVCQFFGVSIEAVQTRLSSDHVSDPRKMFCFIAREMGLVNRCEDLESIVCRTKRDINYLARTGADLVATDRKFRKAYQAIKPQIKFALL